MSTPTKLTPRQLAKEWGVSLELVMSWIRSGELRAMDAKSNPTGERSHLLIDRRDVEAFEKRRTLGVSEQRMRKQRKKGLRDVPRYV